MPTWSECPPEVIHTAQDLIAKYHPTLTEARIAFVFRSEGIKRADGYMTIGQASKVSPKNQVFMDYDFLIWLSEEDYANLTTEQRTALIDHELCHCLYYDDGTTKLRPHDVEEFATIVYRHGLWDAALLRLKAAIDHIEQPAPQQPTQLSIPGLPGRGVVAAITLATARTLDQAADALMEADDVA